MPWPGDRAAQGSRPTSAVTTGSRSGSLQEVRTIHYGAMTLVWNVAPHPHPHATAAEAPENWRQHEIQPLAEG